MSRTFRRKNKNKNNSNVKKAPPVSYNVCKDITKNKEPKEKRDKHGNIIYASMYVGDELLEYWVEYNNLCQPVYYYDSRHNWWKCKYNNHNNIAYYWDNTGYEEIYNYYRNNVVIRTDSFGNKVKQVIDINKLITRDLFITSNIYN